MDPLPPAIAHEIHESTRRVAALLSHLAQTIDSLSMGTALPTRANPRKEFDMNEIITYTSLQHCLEHFREQMSQAVNGYVGAAQAYAYALDTYPDEASAAFRAAAPSMTNTFWQRLEKIGRGEMHTRLLFGHYAAERYIMKLPYSQQKACLEHGVEVLSSDGSVLLIQPERLTTFQCKMVFNGDGLRDLPAQRAWLESQRLEEKREPKAQCEYEVTRRGLVVHEPATFTANDLLQILARMGVK